MPMKKRKRKFKKKQKRIVRYRRPLLPLGGFPERKLARLKYAAFITLNPTALGSAVPVVHHFRANSLYDPDYTGIGHQPRGMDEHAAIYDHYCVIGSKIKVSFESDVDHLAQAGQYCFLMLQDTNDTPTSLVDIMEESNRNKIQFRQRSTTTGRNIVLKKNYSPYKMFGIPRKDSLLTNVNLNPQVHANPAEDAIFTIGVACSRTTTTDPPQLTARVEIEYLAIFTEKRPMQLS